MNTTELRINKIKEQIDHLTDNLNGSYALGFYDDYSDDFATRKYLEDMMDDWADNQIDISYDSLLNWLREEDCATDYIEKVVAEGLIDCRNFDFYKAIQVGQSLFYRDAIYEDYSTLEQLHKLHRELAELKQEQVA